MDTVLVDRLTRFVEKMVLDGTPEKAENTIHKQIREGKTDEVRAALKGVTDNTVKPVAEGWLKSIKDLQPSSSTNTPSQKPSPAPDNDDLSWLTGADKSPRNSKPQLGSGSTSPTSRTRTGEVPPVKPDATTDPTTTSSPTPTGPSRTTATMTAVQDRLKNSVSPDMLAFLKQYAPGLGWFIVALIGIAIMASSFLFASGFGLYPIYAIVYYPLAIFRHIQLNAFVRFNTRLFWSRHYVGQSYNTVYYQDRPNGLLNWVINIMLTILVMFYLYAFREAWAQGRFLYQARQAWQSGKTLPTRSAQWGRGRNR